MLTHLALALALWMAPGAGRGQGPGTSPQPAEARACASAGCHAGLIEKPVVHAVAAAGDCETCHVQDVAEGKPAKGSEAPAGHPFKPAAGNIATICTTCHEDPVADQPHPHDPAASGECTICHEPHASAENHLLRERVTDLCTGCHSDQADEIARAVVHGVIRDLGCTACHDPHGAQAPKLLRGAGNHLCLECHVATAQGPSEKKEMDVVLFGARHVEAAWFQAIPKLSLPAGMKGHPVAGHPLESAQDPLDTTRPFGCISCHEPHGAQRNSLLRIPATGGSLCAACHSK